LRKRHLQSVSILYIKGRYGYVLFSDAYPNAGQHILQQPERNKTPSMDEEISSRSRKAVAVFSFQRLPKICYLTRSYNREMRGCGLPDHNSQREKWKIAGQWLSSVSLLSIKRSN
jgi:hypothetical protein